MKRRMFTILDNATAVYSVPFYMLTVAEARRGFEALANDKESKIGMHPHDFKLFHIGEFDDETCKVDTSMGFVDLGYAAEYKEHEPFTISEDKLEAVQ